ncbi:MAG: hypothetical protein IPN13_16720 [Bacteroidetes bacterium]|nr:hypothetical protein [Bacteroidota bacterium]
MENNLDFKQPILESGKQNISGFALLKGYTIDQSSRYIRSNSIYSLPTDVRKIIKHAIDGCYRQTIFGLEKPADQR